MRYKFIFVVFTLFWLGMVIKLYQISIDSNQYYLHLSKENIERKQFVKPVRGEITDKDGNLLAMNQIGFSISIKPHLKSTSEALALVIEKLTKTFPDINKEVMIKVYKKYNSPYNHKFIKVVDFISYAEMMSAYSKLSILDNLEIEAETKRYYPYGRYTAHVVGYTGKSNSKDNAKDKVVDIVGKVGKTGLERYYNKVLEGELGYKVSKVTATNKEIETLENIAPSDNKNIQLSIDMNLQSMIYERFGKHTGVAIVMRTNGELLASVSYPAYDPNMFVGGISIKNWKALQGDLNHPFTNKFIHGTYPPGSAIKMGMALAFSLAMPNVLHKVERCTGHITLGKSKHKFRCWSRYGHGTVGLRKAIRESCDVYFYNKSLKVGINAMSEHLRAFGFGLKTGVDLPREYSGLIPSKQWKMKRYKQPWYMGETVIASIGQGYDLVTPLQIARYTGVLATQKLVTPHFATVVDGKVQNPSYKKVKLNSYYLSEIRKGMYDVCNTKKGTAYKALHKMPIKVAGKTGTSQVASISQSTKKRLLESELAYFKRSHAWITTYAPYTNPKFIVTVLVEHGGHGGSTAGPIVADIYKWLYKNKYFD